MENKAHALAAGIFVALASALLLLLAGWLTRDGGQRDVYEISTRETVTGLQPQAPVRLRGVDVGKVESIGFDPRVQGNVLVRLGIERGAPITRETFATLGFLGVTGLAFVQLDDSGKPAALLPPDPANPPRIPLQPGLVSKLSAKGEAILDQVEQVSVRLNQLLAEPNQQRIATALDGAAQAAGSVERMSTRLAAILDAQLGPDRVSIPAFVKNADSAVVSLRGTSEQARVALGELTSTMRQINAKDGPLQQLSLGAQSLSQAAEVFTATTLPQVNRVADDGARAVRQFGRTVSGINENPQSLIFGGGAAVPGPGEPGFAPPAGPRP